MSILGRRIPFGAAAVAVLLFVVIAGSVFLPAMSQWAPSSGRHERVIALVARDMAFYLESDPSTPNPVIAVKAGERIRLVLRNGDRGILHDFAVPALHTAIDAVRWNEHRELALVAPSSPGTYEYVCRPHSAMMRGTIIIRD